MMKHPLYIDYDLLTSSLLIDYCCNLHKRLVIITDSNIKNLYGTKLQNALLSAGLHVEVLSFPAGENYKTRATKQQLEDELFARQYGRDVCIIALGGGVVTDLVGYLAATYCRGVPVIYTPTTLLAMVDASIGGKTGVDTPFGKNLIGTITQPHAVFMDLSVLQTLPFSEWRNGVVEIIKHALIADLQLFRTIQTMHSLQDLITPAFIKKNCLIKQAMISQDERDLGQRQLLNFGHTIGHAIEYLEDYQIAHGEAVAIGMLVECYLSVQAGYLHESVLIEVNDLLLKVNLPLRTRAFDCLDVFCNALILDKKSINAIPRFVLLEAIGQPHIVGEQYTHGIDRQSLNAALFWARQKFSGASR